MPRLITITAIPLASFKTAVVFRRYINPVMLLPTVDCIQLKKNVLKNLVFKKYNKNISVLICFVYFATY